MSTETELKLWHWYVADDEDGFRLSLVMGRGDNEVYCVTPPALIAAVVPKNLIGPIAGPGEPPPAPKDREDAKRMANLFARRSRGRAERGEATYYAYRDRFLDSSETWRDLSDEERDGWASVFADGNAAALEHLERERDEAKERVEEAEERATAAASESLMWQRRAEVAAGSLDDLNTYKALERALCRVLGLDVDESGPSDIERAVAKLKANAAQRDAMVNIAQRQTEQADEWKRRAKRLSEVEQENARLAALLDTMGEQVGAVEDAVAVAEREGSFLNLPKDPDERRRFVERLNTLRPEQVVEMCSRPDDMLFEALSQAAIPDAGEITGAIVAVAHEEAQLAASANRDVRWWKDSAAMWERRANVLRRRCLDLEKRARSSGAAPDGHVRVRIDVEVDAEGGWSAAATENSGCELACLRERAMLGGIVLRSVVEADVPLPREPETVRGTVAS